MGLIIPHNVQNIFSSDLTMLQLQGGAGKPFVNEGNLRELKTLNTFMHSGSAKRTLCKYPSCDANPYLDSKLATTFKKRKK